MDARKRAATHPGSPSKAGHDAAHNRPQQQGPPRRVERLFEFVVSLRRLEGCGQLGGEVGLQILQGDEVVAQMPASRPTWSLDQAGSAVWQEGGSVQFVHGVWEEGQGQEGREECEGCEFASLVVKARLTINAVKFGSARFDLAELCRAVDHVFTTTIKLHPNNNPLTVSLCATRLPEESAALVSMLGVHNTLLPSLPSRTVCFVVEVVQITHLDPGLKYVTVEIVNSEKSDSRSPRPSHLFGTTAAVRVLQDGKAVWGEGQGGVIRFRTQLQYSVGRNPQFQSRKTKLRVLSHNAKVGSAVLDLALVASASTRLTTHLALKPKGGVCHLSLQATETETIGSKRASHSLPPLSPHHPNNHNHNHNNEHPRASGLNPALGSKQAEGVWGDEERELLRVCGELGVREPLAFSVGPRIVMDEPEDAEEMLSPDAHLPKDNTPHNAPIPSSIVVHQGHVSLPSGLMLSSCWCVLTRGELYVFHYASPFSNHWPAAHVLVFQERPSVSVAGALVSVSHQGTSFTMQAPSQAEAREWKQRIEGL